MLISHAEKLMFSSDTGSCKSGRNPRDEAIEARPAVLRQSITKGQSVTALLRNIVAQAATMVRRKRTHGYGGAIGRKEKEKEKRNERESRSA